ncbi:metallophosphoesterase family protein [Halobacillus salinus]|uniref:metallophosphoesterase family protein n=1 Tax=Halobacillus salinus TaxID=192814 RepID=UPI0009A84BB3|nr:metallophosphoesterase family protein [Halobacillus salinus]
MSIALLTDIHGNAPALRAVLQELDEIHNLEHLYVLGDLLAIGPDSNEVLELLFSRNDVSVITGNHDEAVLTVAKDEPYPKSHGHVKAHHQWIADRLDQRFIPLLEELPRTIDVEWKGYSLHFTHYALAKPEAPISEDPFHKILSPSLKRMERMFRSVSADLIGFGHHHPAHHYEGEAIFINPGALGCNNRPTAPYAIVDCQGDKLEVNFKEAHYDNEAFLKSYHKLKVPDREFILDIFHGGQLDQKNGESE